MKIIKRSGSEVNFDIQKIIDAIKGANSEVSNKIFQNMSTRVKQRRGQAGELQ